METESWEGEPSVQSNSKEGASSTLALVNEYWRIILKRWYIVLGLTVLLSAINAYRVFHEESVYFAQASLEVRPARLALGEQALEPNSSYTAISFINTQMTVARSRAVADIVVQRLGEKKVADILDMDAPDPKNKAERDHLVDVLVTYVSATQLKETFIIFIGVESTSPQSAALLANTWAQSLMAFNRESEIQFNVDTGEALTKQVERLQTSIKEKEGRLTHIAGTSQIQVLDQQLNVTMQGLTDQNTQLLAVQKELIEKQANLRRIQNTDPKALTEVMSNSAVLSLQQACTQAEQLYAEQSKIFKPDWPGLQQQKSKKDEACNQFDREIQVAYGKILQQIQGDLNATRSKEASLRHDFDASKTQIQDLNQKTSDYQSLKADLDNEKKMLDQMLERRQTAQLSEAGGMQGSTLMRIVEMATPRNDPIRPKRLQSIATSVLLGLGLGLGLAFGLNLLNLKVHSHEEIERMTNYRFLAFIPDMEQENHVGIEQNAFRYLAKHLSTIKLANIPARVVMVTSPEPKEGKTFISSNLALSQVSRGKRTLLIDTDIHRPSIHSTFQVPLSPGLADLLVESGAPDFEIFPRPSTNLTIVPAGEGNTEVLSSILENTRFAEIMRAALREYDQVIVDSGPLLVTPETLSVAQNTDGVILVVRNDYTSIRALKVASDLLDSLQIRVLGAIMNRANPKDANSFYHYYRLHAYSYYGPKAAKVK
jgi:polysaccharide biosynthesis transport protein